MYAIAEVDILTPNFNKKDIKENKFEILSQIWYELEIENINWVTYNLGDLK